MPTVSERVSNGRFVSIELLPPRSPAGEAALATAVRELAHLDPAFIAVTYGANGSDRGRTESLVAQLAGTGALPLPHLTCAAHRRAELVTLLERYRGLRVENLLALHGDPPLSATQGLPEGELRYAIDLVHLAREHGMTCVGVAVHPKVTLLPHPVRRIYAIRRRSYEKPTSHSPSSLTAQTITTVSLTPWTAAE